jgi:hypothetical protein
MNEKNLAYNVFSIDGKFLVNINTNGKPDYLYKMQVPHNTLLIVQESSNEKRNVQKVFCY